MSTDNSSGDLGPDMPADQGLVTQMRALGVIYAGWVALDDGCGFSVDDAAGLRFSDDPTRLAEFVQMGVRLRQAVADGHAEEIGEPDEDGYRQLRLTDAGLAVLDAAAAALYDRPTPPA
ncbi:hypothetical protein AB0F93_03655 [Micromonospora tulbaghiae]|uniref:hypothetical protein n=1 Tax=Micromonospora tulbaghiae TaxID=479978 RepID=UPI00333143C0